MKEKLSEDFIIELFKCCLLEKRIFETCKPVLKYIYIDEEELKEIWSEMCSYFDLHDRLPTIGVLTESFKGDRKVRAMIAEIKKTVKPDTEVIIREFQEFIKKNMFLEAFNKIVDNHNKSGDMDKSYQEVNSLSKNLIDFNLISNTVRERLYDGFEERYNDYKEKTFELENGSVNGLYVPTLGIDPLNYYAKGKLAKGDLVGFLAQSGIGKSTILRWIGVSNANAGGIVVHFQGEDTKDLCVKLYETTWIGKEFDLVANGKLTDKDVKGIVKTSKNLKANGGEVYIEAFEKFGTASLRDCYNILLDIESEVGRVDCVVWDYLEKFDPGDGKRYKTDNEGERAKRKATADKMKNICLEFNAVGFTATQASSVKKELLNDPNFHMSRQNIAEVKALVDPFSFFYTLNQTDDESDSDTIRIFIDKMRKAKSAQLVSICQNREIGRFYDRGKTLEYFWDADKNEPK